MTDSPFAGITDDEVRALEEAAAERVKVIRPTPAPFPWAEPFLTIGVTGTNGKTSTSCLIAAAIAAAGHSVVSETTLDYRINGQVIDVPRTTRGFVSAMQRGAQLGAKHAVVEATSEALARGHAKLWRFDVGVFTNLSRDHLNVHGCWEHYLASKAQLFVHLAPGRAAVLNACDPASLVLDRVIPKDVVRIWYGVHSRGKELHCADLVASHIAVDAEGTRVELEATPLAARLGGVLQVRMIGDVFAENALAAAAAALHIGCPPDAIRHGLATCRPVAGRFEIVHRCPTVAVDFAHTPDALARTLDTARLLAGRGRVIAVFGAGGERDQEKRRPMGRAVGQRVDVAIVTNDNPRTEEPGGIARQVAAGCRQGGRAYVSVVLDRTEAIAAALREARADDVVVIAGKGHEKGQTIGTETQPFSDAAVVRSLL